jgi:hypothetical protein
MSNLDSVRLLNFLHDARLQTGVDIAEGSSVLLETDPDGVPVVVTRTRLSLSVWLDSAKVSQNVGPAVPPPQPLPEGAVSDVREESAGLPRVETIKHPDGSQSVKIGGMRL